jgi:hypothetical protein
MDARWIRAGAVARAIPPEFQARTRGCARQPCSLTVDGLRYNPWVAAHQAGTFRPRGLRKRLGNATPLVKSAAPDPSPT